MASETPVEAGRFLAPLPPFTLRPVVVKSRLVFGLRLHLRLQLRLLRFGQQWEARG